MNADWSDLRTRILSAVVLIVVGGVEIWLGGAIFAALVIVVTGVMMWELAEMTSPNADSRLRQSVMLGALAGLALAVIIVTRQPLTLLALVLPSLAGIAMPRRDRVVFASYAFVIMASGLALIALRVAGGLPLMLWLVAVIMASDVMGYFAGRILGGPKFWPKVSPKKTWSGTIAGWVGATLVGVAYWAMGFGPASIIWFSPIVAFAGQMGDIVESAIKRRAGVKDSSNLIPGHGGFLDRFDALMFGAIVVGLPLFIGIFLMLSQKLAG